MAEHDKQRYLVGHNYGQGGVWAYVMARSPDEIAATFEGVEVFATPYPWMTDEVLKSFPTFDVDHPTGWLALCSRAK